MIVQKICWVDFNPVGSHCFLKPYKNTTNNKPKISVLVEPVWYSLDNVTLLRRSN